MTQPHPALNSIQTAVDVGKLSAAATDNLRTWLTEPRYATYADAVAADVEQQKWQELDDAFCAVIPFGTGGRRGKMYPIGPNVINQRTIGESAQGLATYVKQHAGGAPLRCAIAYDTRHRSQEFAKLSAEVMVAAGFEVAFLEDCRSTPELSFAVRYKQCACGIMITASHNPPSDNGFKAYWSTGGQLVPPHDSGVIDEVYRVEAVERADFDEAVNAGKISLCQNEVDPAFVQAVAACALPGPRDLKIIYSPLHGVGASAVCPVLAAAGFQDVEIYAPHAALDGDFPNVPGHVSNPENPVVFAAIVTQAKQVGADLVLASDPDCDRIGLAAPLTTEADSDWATMTGNQIAALLTEYVLERRQAAGSLTSDHYLVKTLVTTEMMRRIGDAFNVATHGNLLVGFKWIGEVMDQVGPEKFVFGGEESHGYLLGQYARDKDAAAAAMLVAGLAAQVKAEGKTLHEKLDALYWQYGYHAEKLFSLTLPGAQGMEQMKQLMQQLREAPPETLAGLKVATVRDYLALTSTSPGANSVPLDAPRGEMLILDLEAPGTYVAVRPSGTEPKVKFYMFTYEPAEQIHDLDAIRAEHDQRLESFADELRQLATSIE